jgi:hypothetical protein
MHAFLVNAAVIALTRSPNCSNACAQRRHAMPRPATAARVLSPDRAALPPARCNDQGRGEMRPPDERAAMTIMSLDDRYVNCG